MRYPRRRYYRLLLLERYRRRLLARLGILVLKPNPLHPRRHARGPTSRRASTPRQTTPHTTNKQRRLCSRESRRASLPTADTQRGDTAC